MMDGCIKLDALLSAAKDYDWISGLKTVLKRIPIADTVEVVRCKDCKNFIENLNDCISGYGLTGPEPMDFCPYGERRADNGK